MNKSKTEIVKTVHEPDGGVMCERKPPVVNSKIKVTPELNRLGVTFIVRG